MAKTHQGVNWATATTAAVAGVSMALNIVQYRATQVAQREANYDLRSHYAFANDHALQWLYALAGVEGSGTQVDLVGASSIDSAIRAHIELVKAGGTWLRQYPVASFVVVENTGLRDLSAVRITRGGDELALVSLVRPGHVLLAPIDFRPPSSDAKDPLIPDVARVSSAETKTVEVRPSDPVTWLHPGLFQLLVRRRQ